MSQSAYHHSEAATVLGVSSATLRRLAKFYEDAFELMPTDARGGRVYPDHALKRIQAARALFENGRAANLEMAFVLLASGDSGSPDEVIFKANEPEPLEQLLIEFRGMRGALEHMSNRMDALQDENQRLREQVLKQLGAPEDDTRERELEAENAELKQRNAAMLQELERRRQEVEAKERSRPWWSFWTR